jgi:aconitate decarboxylase
VTNHTQRVAEFCSGLDLADVPGDVVGRVQTALIDSVGCGIYGSTLPWSKTLLAGVQAFAGSGDAVVFGAGATLPPDTAALVNGAFIHSFEFDDLQRDSFIHPGSSVVPPVLAYVNHSDAPVSGQDVLAALVVGYEVEIRAGLCAGLGLLRQGFHNSAVVGPVGAAAAMARLLKLSPEKANEALGAGATQAGGLISAQFGAMFKRFHPGRAAQSGFYAGLLVDAGFSGIKDVFDQSYGGYPATMTSDYDLEELTTDLGREYRAGSVGFKMFPSSASCYTTIQACLWAHQEAGIRPGQVESVRIHCSTATAEHCGWPYKPDTVTTAQMNLLYCGAAALTDGIVDNSRFTGDRIGDPAIVELASRFEVITAEAIDAGGRSDRHKIKAEFVLRDGRTLTHELDAAYGFGGEPVTDDDIRDKFLRNTAPVLGDQNKALYQLLSSMRDLDDARVLTAAVAGRA